MIRYRKLGYVDLCVTDLTRAKEFYEDIVGLEYMCAESGGALRFSAGTEERTIVIHAGKPGFRALGLMLEDADQLHLLTQHLSAKRVAYTDLSAGELAARNASQAVRVVVPHLSAAFECYVPAAQEHHVFQPKHTSIQRIGHVVFNTPNKVEVVDFLRDVLNFRTSDNIGDRTTFMRPFGSPFHHGVAVIQAPNSSMNHVNFMVSEIDDIGRALNRLRKNDVPIVFGPGRHPPSGSVFLYFLDPDGLTLEYSYGMEEFPDFEAREPRVLPAVPESLDTWGAFRDMARMSAVGAIAGSEP